MKDLTLTRCGKLAGALFAIGMLGACANMADTPAGTPLSQVTSQYGQATYSCSAKDGEKRLIWSQQPYGQYAWGTNVNAAGNTDRIMPLLTDEHFRVLQTGTWTPEQVRCEFGPPAEITTVGLPSSTQIVWSYRYRQASVWNSLMYVYFGTDGQKVTRVHPGPDPMYDPESLWLQ